MPSRRRILKAAAMSPLVLPAGSLVSALLGMNAQAADPSGYKALVCVFLFGGMDCHDTVLPYDEESYNSYAQIRASLLSSYEALPGGSTRTRDLLLPLDPATSFGQRQFALPPEMSALHDLYRSGNAAIIGNVGPLIQPTNSEGFALNQVDIPDRLFSHNDQQSTWMSFSPEGSQFGWGGIFGDTFATAGANLDPIFSQISLAGNNVFLSGNLVSTYQIGVNDVPQIGLISEAGNAVPVSAELIREHFTSEGEDRSNLIERDIINLNRSSLEANNKMAAALEGVSIGTSFPVSGLGAQLRAVARTIAARDALGASRQVFFVGLGGFDTHSGQATTLPALQQDISDSLAAFYTATQELGISSDVTAFTASDFGRTLTVNGDGTDHGWGGHHFVVGGAVNGGDIYGDIPVAELGHDLDSGNGRLIPSTAIEQMAAPLGSWFGLSQSELDVALPGLSQFPEGPLGFV